MSLNISDKVKLPLTFVTSKHAILAKSRVGKSYTAQVMAEELLKCDQQVLVLDPTSAWWGLRSHHDGDKPGLPIAVFGGDHGDAELPPGSGKEMARAAVAEGFSAIFDLSNFEPDEMVLWAIDFGSMLYHLARTAMHLFVDEADIFAPQVPQTKLEHKCLKVYSRIVRLAGIKGVGCTLICQRSALLNKSLLSQVDMLTVLRMHHPTDMEPVKKWVAVRGDAKRAKKMMASLPTLTLGQAWLWNPDADIFGLVQIRRKWTYDSGKTPEPGQRASAPKVLAKVDIERLGKSIAAQVEKAKENDPAVLKARVADLERKLAAAAKAPGVPVIQYQVDEEALDRAFIQGSAAAMREAQGQLNVRMGMMRKAVTDLLDTPTLVMPPDITREQIARLAKPNGETRALARKHARETSAEYLERMPAGLMTPEAVAQRTSPAFITVGGKGDLPGPEQGVLDSLAWWASLGVHAPQHIQVAYMAGYSPNTKSFKNARGALRAAGLLEYIGDGALRLTADGARKARPPQLPPTTAELHASVLERLDNTQQKLMRPLISIYPDEMSRVDHAAETNYSPNTKSYKNAIGSLRTLGILTYPSPGSVRASDLLFPTGGTPS